MSVDTTVTEEVAAPAEVEAPAESGQGEVTEATTEAPEPRYFDPSEYSDHLVKVKIAGEEIEVPVADLANGYMRQADYTRKTQSLAEQAKAAEWAQTIQQALARDPRRTLEYLQEQFQPQPVADPYEGMDPVQAQLARELDEVRQWRAEQEYERTYQDIANRVERIEEFYAGELTRDELLSEATRLQSMDLEAVAEAIVGRKLWAKRQAGEQHAANRAAEDTARQQAAADAASISSQTHSITPAATPYQGGGIEAALNAAMEQLGLTDADIWGND